MTLFAYLFDSQNVPMGDPMGGPSPPPIAYGGNFQLRGDRDGPPKSSAGGPADQVVSKHFKKVEI